MTVVDPDKLDHWATWQQQRNDANQDPRDVAAFRHHLAALPVPDPADVAAWGVPACPPPAAGGLPPDFVAKVEFHIAPGASVQGRYAAQPLGVIVHGSRSGRPQTLIQEYTGTCAWLKSGTGGTNLAWTATIGPKRIGVHTLTTEWGWNAGDDSKRWLAVEMAQPTLATAMPDEMVNTLAYWWLTIARRGWPDLDPLFKPHGSFPQGAANGKTDVYPEDSSQWRDFHNRLLQAIGV